MLRGVGGVGHPGCDAAAEGPREGGENGGRRASSAVAELGLAKAVVGGVGVVQLP